MGNEGKSASIKTGAIASEILMDLVLKKSGLGYVYQSDDLDTILSGNLPEALRLLATAHEADESAFGAVDGTRLTALKRSVAHNNTPASTEVDVTAATGVLTYRIDIERVDTPGMTGILSVITDISEPGIASASWKTLLRELSHRSKNLLAIIQGIATQTARQALSLDYFLTKFRGRIPVAFLFAGPCHGSQLARGLSVCADRTAIQRLLAGVPKRRSRSTASMRICLPMRHYILALRCTNSSSIPHPMVRFRRV